MASTVNRPKSGDCPGRRGMNLGRKVGERLQGEAAGDWAFYQLGWGLSHHWALKGGVRCPSPGGSWDLIHFIGGGSSFKRQDVCLKKTLHRLAEGPVALLKGLF